MFLGPINANSTTAASAQYANNRVNVVARRRGLSLDIAGATSAWKEILSYLERTIYDSKNRQREYTSALFIEASFGIEPAIIETAMGPIHQLNTLCARRSK